MRDWAVSELLPAANTLWQEVPEDHRLRVIRRDAYASLASLKGGRFMLTHCHEDANPVLLTELEEDIVAFQCKARAYELDGSVGCAARRLCEDGWDGSAEELVSTAEGNVSLGAHRWCLVVGLAAHRGAAVGRKHDVGRAGSGSTGAGDARRPRRVAGRWLHCAPSRGA